MIDTGAMVSVIGTDLTNFLGIVKEDGSNILDSPFCIKGIGDSTYGNAIIETEIWLGFKEDANRKFSVQFCALDSPQYKLVIGMDVLS